MVLDGILIVFTQLDWIQLNKNNIYLIWYIN